ncbi:MULTISPECIES: hypothetical protein [unclassified Microbacterium]|uniref:hypothetical protein n=1 Tax=unclassified Microbacterium TaxID=2609290 RepID=UPI0018D9EC44|nr:MULTISPECIES: hypothetical protein [unclassified Microbacterium]
MTHGVERIGFTGHQGLTQQTETLVRNEIDRVLSSDAEVVGLSSLAEGADQIFADLILKHGGILTAVIPSEDYDSTFDEAGLIRYRRLLAMAESVIKMGNAESNEEAFWAAGRYVVENSDRIIAVWNGKPAAGLGGTADVVDYARKLGRKVSIVWPEGSERK